MVVVEGLGRAESVERLAPDAASEGASEAARELYERHGVPVLRFCRSRLRTREEAEDARQTVFLQAFRALRSGVVPISELSWLLKVAENVCRSTHRETRRRLTRELVEDPQALELVPAADSEPELLMPLQEALGRLTESQRQALLLREWKGLSYREVAAQLGTSPGAVEVLLFRARRALAQELEAPSTVRRRRVRGLDLAGLVGLLKQLLGGGTTLAAKSALAAIAVAAATIPTLAVTLDSEESGSPRAPKARARTAIPPPPRVVVPDADSRRGTAVRSEQGPAVVAKASPKVPQAKQPAPVAATAEPSSAPASGQPEPSAAPAPHAPPLRGGTVEPLPTDVSTGPLSSTLDPVVDSATTTVASVTETTDELVDAVAGTAAETAATVTAVTNDLPVPTLP